jgi:hypothetical protein
MLSGKLHGINYSTWHQIFKKLLIWEKKIKNGNLFNFSTLADQNVEIFSQYQKEISLLRNAFDERFQDFRKQEVNLKLFASPFNTDIESVSDNFQIELLELQGYKILFDRVDLQEFYKSHQKLTFMN